MQRGYCTDQVILYGANWPGAVRRGIRSRGHISRGDGTSGKCWQEGEVEETFRQLEEASSKLQVLILTGNFNCPDKWSKCNKVECKQHKRFLCF